MYALIRPFLPLIGSALKIDMASIYNSVAKSTLLSIRYKKAILAFASPFFGFNSSALL